MEPVRRRALMRFPASTVLGDERSCVRFLAGPFVEVAFHHKKTRTLLLTDTLVSIPSGPPAICLEDPEPLLYHARDEVDESKE
eukprot:gene33373-42786_t